MIVLITGASAGIGRKLTLHYLSLGYKVAAIARRKDKLDQLQQQPEANNGHLKTYRADVSDRAKMQQAMQRVEQDLGPLDLVIANAGVGDQRLTPELDLDCFEQVFFTNVLGVAYTLAPAITAMTRRGHGQLVVISSLSAVQAVPRMSSYGASKTAINHQLEGLYWDLKPHGIHVTTICPGFISTDMLTGQGVPQIWQMSLDKAVAKIVKAIAQKRRYVCFPFWLNWALRLLAVTPDFIKGLVFTHLLEWLFPRPQPTAAVDRQVNTMEKSL